MSQLREAPILYFSCDRDTGQGWLNWACVPCLGVNVFSSYHNESQGLPLSSLPITSSSYACCCPSLIASHPNLVYLRCQGTTQTAGLAPSLSPSHQTWLCRNWSSINYHDWTYWLNRLYKTPRPNIFKIVCRLFIDKNICSVIDPLFTSNLSCSKNL